MHHLIHCVEVFPLYQAECLLACLRECEVELGTDIDTFAVLRGINDTLPHTQLVTRGAAPVQHKLYTRFLISTASLGAVVHH